MMGRAWARIRPPQALLTLTLRTSSRFVHYMRAMHCVSHCMNATRMIHAVHVESPSGCGACTYWAPCLQVTQEFMLRMTDHFKAQKKIPLRYVLQILLEFQARPV
jgi:hypothetical protein